MKIAVLLLVAVAVTVTAYPIAPELDELLFRSEVRDDMGQYALQFQTASGITTIEQGALTSSNDGLDLVLVKQGWFRYISPEGEPVEVMWTAGKDGFNAESPQIPKVA